MGSKAGRKPNFTRDEDRILSGAPDGTSGEELAAMVGSGKTAKQCRRRRAYLRKKTEAETTPYLTAEPGPPPPTDRPEPEPAARREPGEIAVLTRKRMTVAASRAVLLADRSLQAAVEADKKLPVSAAMAVLGSAKPHIDAEAERYTANIKAGSGPPRTIEEAMSRLGMHGDSWAAWVTVARLLDGSELSDEDLRIIRERTGGDPPEGTIKEFWAVVGRRGGKSQFCGVVAVQRACRSYPRVTAPEVAVIARTLQQGRVVADYARSAAEQLGVLGPGGSRLVVPIKDGATIRVQPNTSSVRGPTVVAAVLDEVAHYHTGADAAWSDSDLLTALTPALATVRRPLLMGISSPWRRKGVLAERWKAWQAGDRPDGRIVWHGPTRTMNPTITAARIEAEIKANPSLASEFSADFFADGGAWLPPHILADDVVAAMQPNPIRLRVNKKRLHAYADAAGGGGEDSFALAVAEELVVEREVDWTAGYFEEKTEHRRARLVEVLEIPPPFDPEAAVSRCVEVMRRYGLETVHGDNFGAGLQKAVWRRAGVQYTVGDRTASEIYNEVLPALLSGRVDLVNDPVLIEQLRELIEIAGRDPPPKIDHPPGGHDDVSNAACGALERALRGPGVQIG